MIKKFLSIITLACLLAGVSSCETENLLPSTLSEEEVANGLKEALKVGTDTAVTILNKTNGYYKDQVVKILLPPEAEVIKNNISLIPGGSALMDDLILKINRSAEDAASEATPIFKQAITEMTISDAWNILKGTDTAATHYLKEKTLSPLTDLFKPKIKASLGKKMVGDVSAESSYQFLVEKYNTAATVANYGGGNYTIIKNNSLTDYTTSKALKGLFIKVADEEKAIRVDPVARVNDVLKKVFSQQ